MCGHTSERSHFNRYVQSHQQVDVSLDLQCVSYLLLYISLSAALYCIIFMRWGRKREERENAFY